MRLDDWRDRLQEMWAPLGDHCAFAAQRVDERVGFQETRRFEVGSAFKAFVAAEYARQVASGALDPDMRVTIQAEDRVDSSDMLDQLLDGATIPLQEAAEAMIAVSDNTATDLVMRAVGPDRVRALLSQLGLRGTTIPDSTLSIYKRFRDEPGWRPVACLTTMDDLVTFYTAVVRDGALGSDAATDRFLDLMQQEDLIQGATWPDGARCYRKSGLLEPPPQLAMGMGGAFVSGDGEVTAFAFALNLPFPEDAEIEDSPLEPAARTFSEGLRFAMRELAGG
ncbi:MAG: class A beta-lactamase-related serine hydrolase [Chloroflexota bacterium]|nr:class A beta-lactamase-related serine hydrolase [Chloroflexota bacterium]